MAIEQLDESLTDRTGRTEDADSYRHWKTVRDSHVSAFGYAPVEAVLHGSTTDGLTPFVVYDRSRALSPRPSTPDWER
ncbi:hypothetical protein GCM10008992_27660 [Halorubrum aquaticum]